MEKVFAVFTKKGAGDGAWRFVTGSRNGEGKQEPVILSIQSLVVKGQPGLQLPELIVHDEIGTGYHSFQSGSDWKNKKQSLIVPDQVFTVIIIAMKK